MKKLLLTLAVLCGTVSGWADLVKIDNTVNPALPGELKTTEFTGQNYKQYHFTSQKFAAPTNFNTLRLTFMANHTNEKPAGYPYVAISEFYLYDKNGDKVTLEVSKFSSNATETNEGAIKNLCDGTISGDINKYDWYWHSSWSSNVGEYHYLEINVANLEADLSEFSFGYVTRREAGSPTEILVTTGSSTEDVGCQYSAYRLKSSYDLSTQAFRIRNANITSENLYMTIETPNSNNENEGGVKILAKTKNNDAQAFKFISQEDGTFCIQAVNDYYLNTLESWGFNAIETAGDASKFTINYIGHGEFRIKGTKGFVGPNNDYAAGSGHPYELFSNHGADKQYIDWILEPYVTPEYDVVYNYNHDSKTMITEKFVLPENTDYPVRKSFFGVSMAEAAPTGKITSDGTFDFTCTVDDSKFLFEYAPDVESIKKWQYIQMHSNNKKFLKYESNYIAWADKNAQLPTLGKTDAYAWTFVGNPFVGFKMLNKAATTGKALKSTNSGNPAMVNYAEGTYFWAAASNQSGNGYFCMKHPDGQYLNAQNGKVAHWGSNDAGSTMVVNGDFVEITLEEYLSDLQTLIGQAETFVNTHNANRQKLGYYGLDDVQADIDAAKETLTSTNMDEVDVAFLDLQEVLNAPEVNLPVAGKFYRIRNNYDNDENKSGYLFSGTGTGSAQFKKGIGTKASSIFYYTGNKLVSYTTGLYLSESGNFVKYTTTVGENAGTTFAFAKSPVLGKLLISFKDGNRSFHSDNAGEVGDNNGNSNAAGAGQTE